MPKLECVRECECVWARVGACAATSEIERERERERERGREGGREGKRERERERGKEREGVQKDQGNIA